MTKVSISTYNFDTDSLDSHNRHRLNHGVQPLQWDDELTQYAKNHCDYLAENSLFEHSKGLPYGENLYYSRGYGPDGSGARAVDAWYNEIAEYDFNNPGFRPGTGHFTQVFKLLC